MDILSFALGMNAAKGSGGSNIELIENLPIAVDFSEGNQLVEAPEGTAVKSAVIQKPENLKAENIAEGIDIAGIVGTLTSGGGETGGSFRYFSGSFTPTATQETITHSMGEVPDIIIVIPNRAPTNNTMIYTMGFSQAMIDKTNGKACNYAAVLTSQGAFRGFLSEGIENDFGTDRPYRKYGGIRKVTDSTFTIGSSSEGKLAVGNAYDYYAVCGIV